MRQLSRLIAAAALAGLVASPARAGPACTLDRATGTTIDAKPLLTNAYGSRWNAATNRVVYMSPGADGYYRLYTMRPDGSDKRELTADRPGLPTRHRGSPYWHPSGRYVLFIAEKPDWKDIRLFGNPDFGALPGFGMHDDMWLISADGASAWRLTDLPGGKDEGVLMPVFSPDGKRVAWSQRRPGGTYEIRIADFVETPTPRLDNIRVYQPGGDRYYEPGSFSSDGASLTYTSDQDTHNFWFSQIYRLDLATGQGARLTHGGAYNEHPTVVKTPTGDWIVYMSTRGVDRFPWRIMLGTDWRAMRMDGSGDKRLTTMNVNRDDNPQNARDMRVATTVAPSPAGDYFLGDVQDSLVRQTGMVEVVRLVCP